MLRMMRRAQIPLIILMLLGAIFAPAPIKGYWDLRHAEAEWVSRRFQEAGRDYESAARVLLWSSDLWEKAALAYASAGDWARAMPLFGRAQALGALSADGWDVYGTGYWLRSDNLKALEAWDAGLHQDPQALKFYARFALAYRALGYNDAERQALETWLASGGGTAEEHYRTGELTMVSDPARAQAELAQAAAMDKTYGPAVATLDAALAAAVQQADDAPRMVIIGRGLALVQDWQLAQAAFDTARRADPQNAEAWAWLGEARQQTGQDGREQLDRALALDPGDTVVHGLRGLYWKRQGQFSKAVAEYQAAAQTEPDNADWQAALGDAYTRSGDLISALAAYQKATELAPTNAMYWQALAAFCADNAVQLLDVGLPAAEKAATLAPNDPQVLDTLGWTYSQAGLLYKAEQALTKAVSLAAGSALAHLHLGENFLRQGNASPAQAELRAASALDPEGPIGALADKLLRQYFP
jgi:tetratricopeptide (TPR) repeat protein